MKSRTNVVFMIFQDMAYRYGQNIGIAFQLVDDWLDFVSSADMLGNNHPPTCSLIKLFFFL